MTQVPHIFIAQLNLTVGDIAGNVSKISEAYQQAATAGAELVVCSEMAIVGYPPEDLIYTPALQRAAMDAVSTLSALTVDGGAALLVGGVWVEGDALYNAAFLLDGGAVVSRQYKHHLPNYGPFDEVRVFASGPMPEPIAWRDYSLGVLVCEDLWHDDVPAHLASGGADVLIALNASPFEAGKHAVRMDVAKRAATQNQVPVIYVNQVGGQDELVFDGGSFVMGADGVCGAHAARFEDALWDSRSALAPVEWSYEAELYAAMMVGLRDYVEKNGFPGVVIGLSGGIDSALTAAVAVDALGAARVHCVMLPSPYTSQMSLDDAAELAANFGVRLDSLPIDVGMKAVDTMLAPIDGALTPIAEENIQSRLRGLLLMSLSNSLGSLLITTGNKSEMAVGYATLYGDMCGAYSVLKDVYKMDVFALSRWRNMHLPAGAKGPEGAAIVERIITRPPSAELRDDQKDEDSLPAYPVLDAILFGLVEKRQSVADVIVEHGFDEADVKKIAKLLTISEYKRRQAPPGVKLSPLSFGRDRRFPLTNKFVL